MDGNEWYWLPMSFMFTMASEMVISLVWKDQQSFPVPFSYNYPSCSFLCVKFQSIASLLNYSITFMTFIILRKIHHILILRSSWMWTDITLSFRRCLLVLFVLFSENRPYQHLVFVILLLQSIHQNEWDYNQAKYNVISKVSTYFFTTHLFQRKNFNWLIQQTGDETKSNKSIIIILLIKMNIWSYLHVITII